VSNDILGALESALSPPRNGSKQLPEKPQCTAPIEQTDELQIASSYGGTIQWDLRWGFAFGYRLTQHFSKEMHVMLKILSVATMLGLMSTASLAQGSSQIQSTVPASAVTVTDWYKQNVYDPKDNKIGEVMDVLVDDSGKIASLIVGVGGFVGAGEKDVAVNFSAVKRTTKDNKVYLTMDTTKDALKNAAGFKYDRNKTTWVPDNSK
jgi:sporulation protein YlmC with PRC-barrel domain